MQERNHEAIASSSKLFIGPSGHLTTSRSRLWVFHTGAAESLDYFDLIGEGLKVSGAGMGSLEALRGASMYSRIQGLASNAEIS